MNITITQDNSRIEQLGSNGAAIIDKLYELAIDPNNILTLKGNISTTGAYGFQVDYLNTNYGPNLTVNATNRYIYFEDPNIESYLASINIGTNGKVTEAQAAAATVVANAANTTITKFNELKYFTSIVESKNGWTGANSGSIKFKDWTALQEIDISNFTSLGHNNINGAEDTFRDCFSLKKVTASSKLKKIGYCAFFGCTNLEDITGLSGTIELWGNAFQNCNKLKQSSIQDCTFTYNYVNNNSFNNMFRECHALTSISLDPSITILAPYIFCQASSLVSVSGIQNITQYLDGCFQGCSNFEGLIDLTDVTRVNHWAFAFCNKLKFTGSTNGLQYIGGHSFRNTDLSGATVTINVNPQNYNTFTDATLPSVVTIGSQVTDINSAFQGAKGNFALVGGAGLTVLNVKNSEVTSISFPNITEVQAQGCDSCVKIANTSDIAFWSTLQTIGTRAFLNCKFSGSVTLPNVRSIGDGIFQGCSGLTSVTFGGNSITQDSDGSALFNACTNLQYVDISGVTKIGVKCFESCQNIQTLIAPDVVTVGKECFRTVVMNQIFLPSCTYVTQYAFSGTISQIILPAVETIESEIFNISGAVVELGNSLQKIPSRINGVDCTNKYIIRNSTVLPMNGVPSQNRFWDNTSIYVPRNLINSYKSASGWSSIQGRNGREVFYALEDSIYASSTWYQNV